MSVTSQLLPLVRGTLWEMTLLKRISSRPMIIRVRCAWDNILGLLSLGTAWPVSVRNLCLPILKLVADEVTMAHNSNVLNVAWAMLVFGVTSQVTHCLIWLVIVEALELISRGA